jgi:putative transposase
VTNNIPYAESPFRTCKYRPGYPRRPFGSVDEARAWTQRFVRWYDHEHIHAVWNSSRRRSALTA